MEMKMKTTCQKMYEKLRMAQLFPLRVMIGMRGDEPGMYICAEGEDGVVPLARLLPQSEQDETEADFEKSASIHEFFETMKIVDPRDESTPLDDWNSTVGFGFEEAFKTGVTELFGGDHE